MSRVDLTIHRIPAEAERFYEHERLRLEAERKAELESTRRRPVKARKTPYEQRVRAKFAEKRERN
ncbi:hypothetical protein LGM57_10730 [Burkholderia cepacia]|uniref:hypothetical protein n=1 Tax=Burkholderia cepacia TaxID=292 RepID=UPI001CF1D4A9|nr:hypothetical protein [Burkholderia cepacia]MCA7976795.1 hypothetical protein [Burkholderia cepacia]